MIKKLSEPKANFIQNVWVLSWRAFQRHTAYRQKITNECINLNGHVENFLKLQNRRFETLPHFRVYRLRDLSI